ncbi:MAG: ferrochelatase [Bdellovibrio sp.]|nr:ferrochelatase [Bdellovibrio sp.]
MNMNPVPGVRQKILLLQLGSPRSLKLRDIRGYLKEFLLDPRVVDLPRFLWIPILYLFILPFRPRKTRKLYQSIALPNGQLPLVAITEKFKDKIQHHLRGQNIDVESAYILGEKKVADVIGKNPNLNTMFVPMFPQYSDTTTASAHDAVTHALGSVPVLGTDHFWSLKAYIDLSVRRIEKVLNQGNIDALMLSFHGLPKRFVLEKKDPYYEQCFKTYLLLKSKLPALWQDKVHLSFQSRFGPEEWLTPSTIDKAKELAHKGAKNIAVYCPSFVVDCLETLVEIGHELDLAVRPMGAHIVSIPCLNDDDEWARAFAEYLRALSVKDQQALAQMSYSEEITEGIPEVTYKSRPIGEGEKRILNLVFITLFLDLIGFSIIFPLFPALARYYLEHDPSNPFLLMVFQGMSFLSGHATDVIPPTLDAQSLVLFGGILGALYSLLQFLSSPFWGELSDKIGRRPILIMTISGLALSYLIWFFSGSFTLLLLARLLGGMMAGNISTASAVVADVTDEANRSRGMAVIGIAFALGFILGPAIGGLSMMLDLTALVEGAKKWGINPFSGAAFIAFTLSCFNLFLVIKKFPETNPPEKRHGSKQTERRLLNPLKMFTPLPYKGVNRANVGYFLFLSSFSGMEFTLTFLAVERLSFTSMQNAGMFVFVGLIIVLVQGGFVRRKARSVGEKRMVLQGLLAVIPGLVCIAFTKSSLGLYFGLAFLALGSAMVIPCMTALVSLLAPPSAQGSVLGIFRSLGALARVVGPFIASLIYWHYGSTVPYLLGALVLVIPFWLVKAIPNSDTKMAS